MRGVSGKAELGLPSKLRRRRRQGEGREAAAVRRQGRSRADLQQSDLAARHGHAPVRPRLLPGHYAAAELQGGSRDGVAVQALTSPASSRPCRAPGRQGGQGRAGQRGSISSVQRT